MLRKDWVVRFNTPPMRRSWQPDPVLRLLIHGGQIARWCLGIGMVLATAAVCLAAVLGPHALVTATGAEALPDALAPLRTVIAATFG